MKENALVGLLLRSALKIVYSDFIQVRVVVVFASSNKSLLRALSKSCDKLKPSKAKQKKGENYQSRFNVQTSLI